MVKNTTISAMYGPEGERPKGKIGSLVFYTIGEVAVPIKAMEDYWTANNLPREWMPYTPSGKDAFMRTCSADNTAIWTPLDLDRGVDLERTLGIAEGSLKTSYITVRTAGKSNEYILVHRMWLKDGEREVKPTHPNVCRLIHDEAMDRITVVPFPEYKGTPLIKGIWEIANEHYRWEKSIINGARHRRMLRTVLDSMGGVPFMGKDGSWFLPERGETALALIEDYIDEVVSQYKLTGYATSIMTVDAVDSEKLRNQIAEDVAKDIQAKWEELNEEVLALLTNASDDDSPRKKDALIRKLEGKLAKAKELGVKMEQYETMLERRVRQNLTLIKNPKPLKGRAKVIVDEINAQRR